MERGEVGGRGSNSWASWKSTKPHWLAEKKIFMLVQIALKRHPELADVPLMTELARNEDDRKVLAFLSADTGITRAMVTTPDTPRERVDALRRAFDATMKDPQFLAEAEKAGMDISPASGEEAQKVAEFDRQHRARRAGPRQGDTGKLEIGFGLRSWLSCPRRPATSTHVTPIPRCRSAGSIVPSGQSRP